MEKKRNQVIVTVLLEKFILEKVEGYRRACVRRSGHMSRSAAVRHLVHRGLEAVAAGEAGAAQ